MATCPKCKQPLRLVDWKQKCPHCGANVVLYDLQERLMQDADIAEVQYYHFQKKIDRLKASFVGTKLAIVRIFTSLLPVFSLLLPFVYLSSAAPLNEYSGGLGLITVYNMVGDIDVDLLLSMVSDPVNGKAVLCMLIAAVSLVLSILILFVHFACLMLACSPKAKIRNAILDAVYFLLSATAVICVLIMPQSSVLALSLQYGSYLYIALNIAYIAVDFAVLKQGIPVTHKQCYVGGIPIEEYFVMVEKGVSKEELRKEMYARLQQQQTEKEEALERLAHEKDAENVSEEAVTQ